MMDPFKIDISALRQQPGESLKFKIDEETTLSSDRDGLRLKGPLRAEFTVENIGGDFLARGQAEATVDSVCARCLKDFGYGLKVEFLQLFVDDHLEGDDEAISVEGDVIDLKPVIEEALILDLPFNRICDPGCPGICPVCGQDLSEKKCDCKKSEIDIRFLKLLDLKDKLNSKDG
ncbi:MAG: DUF177 domain-containing protein [Actinomycetota bacterium]|nr:DUF177 domain-containing protein [Actinomycetota bacterium]